MVEAQWVAEKRGRQRFVTEQPPYSILVRQIERDLLPTCERYGIGVIPWSPLAGGWLSGRYRLDSDLPETRRAQMIPDRYDMSIAENQAKLEAADALAKLADEAGLTLIEMSLAFLLEHPAVTAPIIGPRTMEQLESQLPAAEIRLSAGRPRPDRRDRAAGNDGEPGRRRLGGAGDRRSAAAAAEPAGALAARFWRRAGVGYAASPGLSPRFAETGD